MHLLVRMSALEIKTISYSCQRESARDLSARLSESLRSEFNGLSSRRYLLELNKKSTQTGYIAKSDTYIAETLNSLSMRHKKCIACMRIMFMYVHFISSQLGSSNVGTSKSSKIIERSMSINVFLSFFFFVFLILCCEWAAHMICFCRHTTCKTTFSSLRAFLLRAERSLAHGWRENWKNTFILHHNLSYLLFFLFIVLLAHSKVESRHGAARVRHRRLSRLPLLRSTRREVGLDSNNIKAAWTCRNQTPWLYLIWNNLVKPIMYFQGSSGADTANTIWRFVSNSARIFHFLSVLWN